MKHANLLPLDDPIAFRDSEFAARDLRHANEHHSHQPNVGIVRLDEENPARRHGGEVWLGVGGADGIRSGWVDEPLVEVLGIVRPRDDLGADDRAGNGVVPAVVGQRAQKCLVDAAPHEFGGVAIIVQHMGERVRLSFEPKCVL